MSNNLLTKHFKSEKKRISVIPQEKKLDNIDSKPLVTKQPSITTTDDNSKTKTKTRRSRVNKQDVDYEYENIMKTDKKKPKIEPKNDDLKIPKTKTQIKRKVELNEDIIVKNTIDDPLKNNKKEFDLDKFISENRDTEMKDSKDEVTTKSDSKPKDDKFLFPSGISDKTKELINKVLLNKNNIIEEKKISELTNSNTVQNSLITSNPNSTSFTEKKELSGKTLEILNKLRSERKNKFERSPIRERERSESIYSLKFRFEELIQEKRKLPLPPTYKTLINVVSDLDSMINFFKLKKKIPRFEMIRNNMEMTLKKTITIDQFKQILFIAPHFYIYKWEKAEKTNEYDLVIDFPEDFAERIYQFYDEYTDWDHLQTNFLPKKEEFQPSELTQRNELFYKAIINYINEIHKKFLKENHLIEFNAISLQTWHSSFNLKNIKEIPEFNIKEKPVDKIQSISDIIKESDLKTRIVKDALDNLTNANFTPRKDDTYSNTADSLSTPKLSKVMNISVFDKIRVKQEAIKRSKEILEYSLTKTCQKISPLNYKEFLYKMRDIFISKQTTALKKEDFYNILLETYPLTRLEEGLNFFTKNFPDFVSIVETMKNGKMIKIDKSKPVKEIIDKIESIKI